MDDIEAREARIKELCLVIHRAEKELKKLEPHKGVLDTIQESLDKFDAERAAGDNWDDKAAGLCELLVTGLNTIQSSFEGHVTAHAGEVNLSTAAGSITYDPDTDEWYFAGRR